MSYQFLLHRQVMLTVNSQQSTSSPANPTKKVTFCGTGSLPVLQNGARCE
jgi:hypothetical protein